ncbi:helix-turn-helix domain-containing protein [Brevibacterium sp.]|uniref:helix-turn-helix domain-containing protein n=1 Tax=Brevibacterium sp. TaxID=1701 RepID=UPI002811649C|nr:helix-turn-helix domain-containing protein [Brevibacterium sp.]
MKKWVTYTEAAQITGRSPRTIRRWVKERHLTPFRGRINRGQLLNVESKMRRARRTGEAAAL